MKLACAVGQGGAEGCAFGRDQEAAAGFASTHRHTAGADEQMPECFREGTTQLIEEVHLPAK